LPPARLFYKLFFRGVKPLNGPFYNYSINSDYFLNSYQPVVIYLSSSIVVWPL
jgi:hypothetical protein